MDPFSSPPQPDEGYSEDPLVPALSMSQGPRFGIGGYQPTADLPAWISQKLVGLPLHARKQIAMNLLDNLPTSVISDIVERLNPRLYIDFVRHLPPEVCLKILEHLDPVSLINVAQSCRTWYTLALDNKLWERLYHLEGWKVIQSEIELYQNRVNTALNPAYGDTHRIRTSEKGHVQKKRALSNSDDEKDLVMTDTDRTIKSEEVKMEERDEPVLGGSIFGSPAWSYDQSLSGGSLPPPESRDIEMDDASSAKGKGVDRIFGASLDALASPSLGADSVREDMQTPSLQGPGSSGITPSTLWSWDSRASRYRVNWKHIYTMRRRLESNWALAKYTNFQLPHPDHPEEGHRECVYSIQFTPEYLVSGSRDRSIRIWNMHTRRLVRPPLVGHTQSVLCLQFDPDPEEDLIVSGSSDSDVILWRFSTGEVIQRLRRAHSESVLNVKFDRRILVTCSKDRSIKIFNRRPLRYGDPGYSLMEAVHPVPTKLRRYGYEPNPADELPIVAPYSLLGSLDGHNAAVNAVQICGDQVVSASGDRALKIWDWTTKTCTRTVLGHGKGIACVHYDGRRIVSGSHDNEVKVFDSATGLEVASLRGHSNLVRAVQAGFGDLPYSAQTDQEEARQVDAAYFKALESGALDEAGAPRQKNRPRNAGSRRPEDITAYGAKLPPGGGGGKFARIVSGSYDQTIIIWRRDKEGVWKDVHHLRQEEAAIAAARQTALPSTAPQPDPPPAPLHPSAPLPPAAPQQGGLPAPRLDPSLYSQVTPSTADSFHALIDMVVQQGPTALQQALAAHPSLLTYNSYLQSAIDRLSSPFVRSQLRETVSAAMVRAQVNQLRARHRAGSTGSQHGRPGAAATTIHPPSAMDLGTHGGAGGVGGVGVQSAIGGTIVARQPAGPAVSTGGMANAQGATSASSTAPTVGPSNVPAPQPAQVQVPQQHQPQQQHQQHQQQPQQQQQQQGTGAGQARYHPHLAADNNPARVFKLQFDARRIICCSQTTVIVGWDFCNSDPELEQAARFFATVE